MPELPEVEIIVRQLSKKLSGQTITHYWNRPQAVLTSPESHIQKNLIHQTIQKVIRKGKYLGLVFSQDMKLWFHLGMTGQLLMKSSSDQPDKHVHFILSFKNYDAVLWFRDIRKFGEVFLVSTTHKAPKGLAQIASDPFEMDVDDFVKRLKTRTGKIKSLLLDQYLISGLGNIYANESLYRAGIHPRKSGVKISKEALKSLHLEIQNCLKEAILCGGSSIDDYKQTDGSQGSFQTKHQVYGRFKKSCLRCGQLIRKIMLSGRSTFFCSNCQK